MPKWPSFAALFVVCVIGIFALREVKHDEFRRIEFAAGKLNGVAIMRKNNSTCPIAILVCATKDVNRLHAYSQELHILADMGYAAVTFRYRTNSFASDLGDLLNHLRKQSWAQKVPAIYIDFRGEDAELFKMTVTQEMQPALIARFDHVWKEELESTISDASPHEVPLSRCQYLVIQNSTAEPMGHHPPMLSRFSIQYCRSAADSDVLTIDRSVAVRIIGEYGRTLLNWDKDSDDVISSNRVGGWLGVAVCFFPVVCALYLLHRLSRKHGWFQRDFRIWWLIACCLFLLACGLTFVHTVFQNFRINAFTLATARTLLVAKAWKEDFEFLAGDPYWRNKPLKHLIVNSELANYTCFRLVNWGVEKAIYRTYVLSPVIAGSEISSVGWRKPLWRYFYPKVKSEDSPAAAAVTVVRHLRERMSIQNELPSESLELAWERGTANEPTFRRLYVASLRSVAIPARLDEGDWVQIWDGGRWIEAPRPLTFSCLEQPTDRSQGSPE